MLQILLQDTHNNRPFVGALTLGIHLKTYSVLCNCLQEKEAMKKLENVRKDHVDRMKALEQTQQMDRWKAELILRNQPLVENCLHVVHTALANQLAWAAIEQLITEARNRGDLVASPIIKLKLETNHMTLHLRSAVSTFCF